MSKQAILNIVMVLGFLAHGYATAEFQVTDERLGVYSPRSILTTPRDTPMARMLASSTLVSANPSTPRSSKLTLARA